VTYVGSHVIVYRVPVVEPRLFRQASIRVEAIQIKIQKFADRHTSGNRLELTPVDFSDELAASLTRFSGSAKSSPRQLLTPSGNRIAPDVYLQIPAAPAIGVHTFGFRRQRDLRENRLVLKRFSQRTLPLKYFTSATL
jgi:hypothetical protein